MSKPTREDEYRDFTIRTGKSPIPDEGEFLTVGSASVNGLSLVAIGTGDEPIAAIRECTEVIDDMLQTYG